MSGEIGQASAAIRPMLGIMDNAVRAWGVHESPPLDEPPESDDDEPESLLDDPLSDLLSLDELEPLLLSSHEPDAPAPPDRPPPPLKGSGSLTGASWDGDEKDEPIM